MLLTTCKSCAPWLLSTFLIATSHANPAQGAIPAEIAETPSSQPSQLSQEHADEPVVAIRRYVPAVPQKKRNPRYPLSASRQGKEGWVVLNYMVDPEGNTYEIEATAYAGDRSFVNAAKRAARRYKYTPAHFNGEPMHSGAATRITFRLSREQVGARPAFVKLYKAFFNQLKVGATTQQINHTYAALTDLGITYLYEDVFLAVVKSAYAERMGDHVRAERNLDRALRYQDDFKVFTTEKFHELQQQLFWHQVKSGSFGDAIKTWAVIEPQVRENEDFESFFKTIAEIKRLQDEGRDFSATGTVYDHYRYSRILLASAFSFTDVDGELAESKLYCDQGFLGFAIKPNVRYNIRDDYQNCTLVVIGDPDTTFTVTEHW